MEEKSEFIETNKTLCLSYWIQIFRVYLYDDQILNYLFLTSNMIIDIL